MTLLRESYHEKEQRRLARLKLLHQMIAAHKAGVSYESMKQLAERLAEEGGE